MHKIILEVKNKTFAMFNQDELENYIPLAGKEHDGDLRKHCYDLQRSLLLSFISKPDKKSLLILGGSGAGKTVFGQNLTRTLWNNYEKDGLVALWVPLTSLASLDPSQNLIWKHLWGNLKIDGKGYENAIKRASSIVVIVDGYEEANLSINLYDTNVFKHFPIPIKLIVMCRKEIRRKVAYKSYFVPNSDPSQFLEYSITKFSELQQSNYIRKYVELNKTAWDHNKFSQYIKLLPELEGLISNPFMLKIALQTLPNIVAKYSISIEKKSEEYRNVILTRYELYNEFTRVFFDNKVTRFCTLGLEKHLGKKLYEKLEQILVVNFEYSKDDSVIQIPLRKMLEKYTRDLAIATFNNQVNSIFWEPKREQPISSSLSSASNNKDKNPAWAIRFFDDENYYGFFQDSLEAKLLPFVRSGCPIELVNSNTTRFLHSSLLEFFAAEHLFMGALTESWIMTNINLNSGNLTKNANIVNFLAENAKKNEALKNSLISIVTNSAHEPKLWKAAANAITILKVANISLHNINLRRIRIGGIDEEGNKWGADLSEANLEGLDFSEADIRYIDLTDSWLNNVKFDRCCMDGIIFNAMPSVSGKVFYSTKGHSFAILRKKEEANQIKKAIFRLNWLGRLLEGDAYEYTMIHHSTDVTFKIDVYNSISLEIKSNIHLPSGTSEIHTLILSETKLAISYSCYSIFQELQDILEVFSFDGNFRSLLKIRHPLSQLLFLNEGNLLVALTPNEYLSFFVLDRANSMVSKSVENRYAWLAAYPENNKFITGGSKSPTIEIWDLESRSSNKLLEHNSFIDSRGAFFSNLGKILSVFNASGHVSLWEIRTQQCILDIKNIAVYCLSFNQDDSQLALGSSDQIHIFDLRTFACIFRICTYLDQKINGLHYIDDERKLISHNEQGDIRIWDLENISSKLRIISEISKVFSYPHSTKIIIKYKGDKKQKKYVVHDIESNTILRTFSFRHPDQFLYFEAKSDNIIYLKNGEIIAEQIFTSAITKTIRAEGDMEFFTCSHNGRYFLYKNKPGKLELVDLQRKYSQSIKNDHTVKYIRFSPTNNQFAILFTEEIWLFSMENNINFVNGFPILCRRKFVLKNTYGEYSFSNIIYSFDFSPDGSRLAAADTEGRVIFWNTNNGKCLRIIETKNFDQSSAHHCLFSVSYHPTLNLLACGGNRRTVFIIDSVNFTNIENLKLFHDCINYISWVNHGQELIVFHKDSSFIQLFKVHIQTNKCSFSLMWQNRPFLSAMNVSVNQATGLSALNSRLLKRFGLLRGSLDKRHSSEEILLHRNSQAIVSSNRTSAHLDKSFSIDDKVWLISLVRKKNENSDHSYLIFQGLETIMCTNGQFKYFYVLKEAHLYLDEDRPRVSTIAGHGLVQIKTRSHWDLASLAPTLEAISFSVSMDQAASMLRNIEADKEQGIHYLISGHLPGDRFSKIPLYSCLTWCEKHLKKIIPPTVVEQKQHLGWVDFFCAIPARHIPAQEEQERADSCQLM